MCVCVYVYLGTKIISGPIVAIQGQKFHKKCLLCICCHSPFVNNRVAVDKKTHELYCPGCFSIAISSYGAQK